MGFHSVRGVSVSPNSGWSVIFGEQSHADYTSLLYEGSLGTTCVTTVRQGISSFTRGEVCVARTGRVNERALTMDQEDRGERSASIRST